MTSRRKIAFPGFCYHLLWVIVLLAFASTPALAGVRVIVSILPQKFFLEQLAGDVAEITVMVPPGASPHTYEPKPSQMKALHSAEMYFTIGVEFEKTWLPRFCQLNKRLKFVDTSRGIEKMPVDGDNATKVGAQNKQPAKRFLDPHIWLSPRLVKKISQNMADALTAIDPAHQQIYKQRLSTWEKKLERLDELLYHATRPMKDHPYFLVFHPSWGYFAREYGLKQLAVEHHGNEPGPRFLAALIHRAKTLGIKSIFVQPQYQGNSDRILARALGGKVVKIDPLAENWLKNMQDLAQQLDKIYH